MHRKIPERCSLKESSSLFRSLLLLSEKKMLVSSGTSLPGSSPDKAEGH